MYCQYSGQITRLASFDARLLYSFVSRIVVYSTNDAVLSFCSFSYSVGHNPLSLDKRKCPCIVSYHFLIVCSRIAHLLAYIFIFVFESISTRLDESPTRPQPLLILHPPWYFMRWIRWMIGQLRTSHARLLSIFDQ